VPWQNKDTHRNHIKTLTVAVLHVSHEMACSHATAVASRTRKIIKNGHVFERGGSLLQNGILNFAFR